MTITDGGPLPNAKHIDRLLAHARDHPDKWAAARDDARGAARDAAWAAAWSVVINTPRELWGARIREATSGSLWGKARAAYLDAAYALIAWDDAGDVLTMPVDAVRLLAACGHYPAVMLLPACIAFESTKEPS
jgi:hypothetical protein